MAWLVSTRSKNEALNTARAQRGTLIASGLIAGGSLFGVLNALFKFSIIEFQWQNPFQAAWAESSGGEILGLGMFGLLFAYATWDSLRAKPE